MLLHVTILTWVRLYRTTLVPTKLTLNCLSSRVTSCERIVLDMENPRGGRHGLNQPRLTKVLPSTHVLPL